MALKCVDCCYYWKEEDEEYACCHYVGSFAAPCEEDYFEDEYDYE